MGPQWVISFETSMKSMKSTSQLSASESMKRAFSLLQSHRSKGADSPAAQELKITREQEMIFQFARRTHCHLQKTAKIAVAVSARSFRKYFRR